MNLLEIYSKEREFYSLLTITLVDTTLETAKQIGAIIFVNNEADETLLLGYSTTVFVHINDTIRLGISTEPNESPIGFVEIGMNELLAELPDSRNIQKWLPLQIYETSLNQEQNGNQILCSFDIQKINELQLQQQSPSKFPLQQSYEINSSIVSNTVYEMSPQLKNRHHLPSNNPPQYSVRIDEEETSQKNQRVSSQTLLGKYRKVNKSTSPISTSQQQSKSDRAAQNKSKVSSSSIEKQNLQRIQGKKTTDTQLYQDLEMKLTKLKKITQNSQFNNLIDLRRQNYLTMKNTLREITEQFNALKRHPCNNCEKKYVPSIEKGISECNQIYQFLLDSAQNQTTSTTSPASLIPKQPSSSTLPVNTSTLLEKTSGSASAAKLKKMLKDVQDKEDQAKEEAKVIKMMRDEMESQRKKNNEIESENRQLKLRIFTMESDLKNMLKKLAMEKLTFSARASFKLQEFRSIFEFFHSLRLEREGLLNEIAGNSQNINVSTSSTFKQRNSLKESKQQQPLKTIQQTMEEYESIRDATLAQVRSEENRIQEDFNYQKAKQLEEQSYYENLPIYPTPYDNYVDYNQNQNQYQQQQYDHLSSPDQQQFDQNVVGNIPEESRLYPQQQYLQSQRNNYTQQTQDNPMSGRISHRISNIQSTIAAGLLKTDHSRSDSNSKYEIQELLSQRKNVIDELLGKLEGI